MSSSKQTVVVIGAGPAGLTAAVELLRERDDVILYVVEATGAIGGISRTVNYKGNRIDIGGHRFFTKSDRVLAWWQEILPIEGASPATVTGGEPLTPRHQPDPAEERMMLVRRRLSRILFLRKLFDYPISLSLRTLTNLGPLRVLRILASYLCAHLFPVRPERSLEDFFINRFGRELYGTFFKDYTRKVWGVPCSELPSEWGTQRVKGLSVFQAVRHALWRLVAPRGDYRSKEAETSLIEEFLYPKYGPGQLWEAAAAEIEQRGGNVRLRTTVTEIHHEAGRVTGVTVLDEESGREERLEADVVFSSMPVRDLVLSFAPPADAEVRDVASGLVYRDFITVGLLLQGLKVTGSDGTPLQDNWIYIQEPDVRLGRLQVFNNWSPFLVADPERVWLGLEYFCNEGDDLWQMDDGAMAALAARELAAIGFVEPEMLEDSVVIRVPKAYPAYLGSYSQFSTVRRHTDQLTNLFLIGRNGMHRYNNMDHSMLSAMTAVGLWLQGSRSKEPVWSVNAETEYHESRNAAAGAVERHAGAGAVTGACRA